MRVKNNAVGMFIFSIVALGSVATALHAESPKDGTLQNRGNALAIEDDAAVRKIVADYEEAWNTHDLQALSKLFSLDAEWINKVGMHWKGRDKVMLAHTEFHRTIFKTHTYHTDQVETRSIAPGVAVAVVTETFESFTAPDGRVFPKCRNRLSYVMVKGTDGWKIAHGQNVQVDEEALKHDPVTNDHK